MKVASRPHDVMADQWIYNLVSGGNPHERVDASAGWLDFMDIHDPTAGSARTTKNIASTFDFKFNDFNDGSTFLYARDEFDNTFVDVDPDGQVDRSIAPAGFNDLQAIHGPTFGFYKDPMAITQLPHVSNIPPKQTLDYYGQGHSTSATFPFIAHPATNLTPAGAVGDERTFTNPVPYQDAAAIPAAIAAGFATTNGRQNLYQARFLDPQLPLAYANGMMFTSKCYQCCNSGFNCNANWHPSNEYDWSFNDIRGHRYNEATDKAAMRPDVVGGTEGRLSGGTAGHVDDADIKTNTPANRDHFFYVLTDPSSVVGRK